MKLGLESYSTRNSGLDPIGVLGLAGELGLDGVLFELSPFTSFRDEDLVAIRKFAEDNGLYIEFGMGSIFRWHPMAEKGIGLLAAAGYDVSVSPAEIVVYHLKIAQKLGSSILRCVGGNLFSRDEGYDMAALADDAVVILRQACGVAADMGIRIAMENHADFTVRELAAILARVNSPAFGFTVDCANVAFDLDDPLRLAGILALHALTAHYKNYRVIRTGGGLGLQSCSLPEGDIDVVSVAEILAKHQPGMNLNIEIHTQFAPFPLAIFDENFFVRHPSPPGDGLAWYVKKALEKEPAPAFPGLPDGKQAWEREYQDLKLSTEWARKSLSHILAA
jgi:sugar phosphate isomerase/epimerase